MCTKKSTAKCTARAAAESELLRYQCQNVLRALVVGGQMVRKLTAAEVKRPSSLLPALAPVLSARRQMVTNRINAQTKGRPLCLCLNGHISGRSQDTSCQHTMQHRMNTAAARPRGGCPSGSRGTPVPSILPCAGLGFQRGSSAPSDLNQGERQLVLYVVAYVSRTNPKAFQAVVPSCAQSETC